MNKFYGFYILALLSISSAASDFFLCEVVVPNFCATPIDYKRDDCMTNPAITLQGTDYDITTGYNVIAFGTLNAAADTEGRMLVQGNAVLSTGYSIGEKVYTKGPGAVDARNIYAAVFGGNLNWPSGSLNPSGNDFYSAAYNEDMYVAGSFTGADDLAARKTSNSESITEDLAAAKSFYTQLQTVLDNVADNIQYTVDESHTMIFTCPAGASSYSIHVPSSAFTGVSSYAFSGCSASVQMVITVPADSTTVAFTSGAISPADREASRTVFNIMGSGRTIKFTSTRFYGIILAPQNNYAVDTNAPGATDGIVIVNNVQSAGQFNRINCTRPEVPAQPQQCVSFESECAGTLFTAPNSAIQGDTRDYNVISFNNFVANTGDIEGRLMVRNNFVAGNGYSIGYMLQTANNLKDRQEAYSLLAGGDCTWGSGSLHPDGTNIPYAGNNENMFCGKSFTGPSTLSDRNNGGCAVEGCLNTIFDAAFTCYSGYSATLAAQTPNVNAQVSESNMILTCSSATATNYVVNIDASMFPQATYYSTSNCNFQAYWTINVVGTADVLLSGDSMVAPPGAVVYNIIGARTIYVDNTAVNGHILAPLATLNQTGGVILGKVVVGDVKMSLQVNREDKCTEITVVEVPVTPGKPVNPGDDTVCTTPANQPITFNAEVDGPIFADDTHVIGQNQDGCMVLDRPIPPITFVASGKVGTVSVPSNAGGKAQTVSTQSSSASVAALSAVLFVVALLF